MIELRDICKTYVLGEEPVRALDHMSVSFAAGDYISVMGPSGSGKSTLLNVIGLLERPDAGSLSIDGQEVVGLPEETLARMRRDYIGFVFQAYHLIPRLSARENVELPLMLAGMAPQERGQRVDEALARLSMREREHHLPNQLSGGQRQRTAIARALVMRPRILLADEPTGNLDSHSGAEVISVLEELNADGITLLVVTHDANLGQRAHRQLWLVDGRIETDERRGETV